MKLIVIILCLLSERYLIHSISYTRFNWFERYILSVQQCIEQYQLPKHPVSLLLLYIMPIILVVSLIYFSLSFVLFGLFGLIINMVVFYYCLGPHNPFYPEIEEGDAFSATHRIGHYLAVANNQLFAVIFWYVVGGPIAVLAFRLISLCQYNTPTKRIARDCIEILEWIPARMTVLLYLLVGHFQAGFGRFMHFIAAKPAQNHQMLEECGLLALRTNELEEIPVPTAQRLIEQAVTVLLVFLALFTLAAWV